jgi:hypothetical protein
VTQLLPLIDALPKIAGKPGAPLSKPPEVVADRGYDSDPHRAQLEARGITPTIGRRRTAHGSGWGEVPVGRRADGQLAAPGPPPPGPVRAAGRRPRGVRQAAVRDDLLVAPALRRVLLEALNEWEWLLLA